MLDWENGDGSTANSVNHFRLAYFIVMLNEIKSNLQTRFESFVEFVDKFDLFLKC
jgi:hypothetical protein